MEDKCKYKYRKLKARIVEVEVQLQQQAQLQAQMQSQILTQTLNQSQAQTQTQNQSQAQTQTQNHSTAQETAQAQNDTDTISNVGNPSLNNIGNPVVTVNVGGYGSDNLVVASAFRAVGVANQPVPANTNVKVLFPEEQFDLANEYNPVTSTFTPRHNGVYLISGTVSFNPNNHAVNYRVLVAIRVNGDPYVAADNDFFGPSNNNNVVNVSTILNLKAGDHVDIIVNSGIAGEVAPNIPGVTSTHFEGARFPSPRT